ncbi:polysaccharide biosynthesis/export family protein [Methylorubrum aminovorans]|uniref:polysaccharide biosynthesis/export family protein n=1 Tax=Methylorubrum aminovorans TaxID=269069 RepID=UPI0024E0B7BA|nr:polysaccharide biosynthesis/export family protein [Methylorubrum aminovorans]
MTALLALSPPKRLGAALLLGLCLLGASPRAAAEAVQYRLGAQDRLRIHVYEWPALTGEFTVGADGTLSLPLIGQVSVTGLQPADLAQEISTRLKARAGLTEPPDTAVGIAQYRPFYVIGGVERSGSTPTGRVCWCSTRSASPAAPTGGRRRRTAGPSSSSVSRRMPSCRS